MGNIISGFELAKNHDLVTLIALLAIMAIMWGGWKLINDKLKDHTTMKGWIKAQRDSDLATEQPIDPEMPRILVPRQRLLDEIRVLREQITLYRQYIKQECSNESCPAFVRMREYLNQQKDVEANFLSKLLELRKETQALLNAEEIRSKELDRRLNEFMNDTIAKREAALDKKDDIIANLLAGQVKKMNSGGGH